MDECNSFGYRTMYMGTYEALYDLILGSGLESYLGIKG